MQFKVHSGTTLGYEQTLTKPMIPEYGGLLGMIMSNLNTEP